MTASRAFGAGPAAIRLSVTEMLVKSKRVLAWNCREARVVLLLAVAAAIPVTASGQTPDPLTVTDAAWVGEPSPQLTVAEYPPDGARSARTMLATTTGPVASPSSGETATGATVNRSRWGPGRQSNGRSNGSTELAITNSPFLDVWHEMRKTRVRVIART